MIYKIVNGLCTDWIEGKLVPRSQLSNFSTRNQLELEIPSLSLERSKNNFSAGVMT